MLRTLKKCLLGCYFSTNFVHSTALADDTYVSNVTSVQGTGLTFTLPMETAVTNLSLGAIVCSQTEKSLIGAELSIHNPSGNWHAEGTVHLRPVSKNCAQLYKILFSEVGNWQLNLKFSDGDSAVVGIKAEPELKSGTFVADSSEGTFGTLVFQLAPVTGNSTSALLCSNQPSPVRAAVLWMPDMGHGSSPTQVVSQGSYCSKIDNMDYFMPGHWEVRTELENGEKLNFKFDVQSF